MPGWLRTRGYRQREAVVSHMLNMVPEESVRCTPLGIWMSKETLSLWVTPLSLSEQTLEPGCLDSNLDTTPHWLGKLFHFSDPHFSHLQNGYDHSTYPIGLLWGLIELIHKVDFRTLYTIITILKQNLKPCRVSVQPKEDFCQKCVKVEGWGEIYLSTRYFCILVSPRIKLMWWNLVSLNRWVFNDNLL